MLYLALRGEILSAETRKRSAKMGTKTGNRYRSLLQSDSISNAGSANAAMGSIEDRRTEWRNPNAML